MNSNLNSAGITANDLALSLIAEASDRPLVLHTRVVSGTGGGPEKTILNSPRFLAPLGYDSICVYYRDPCDEGFQSIERRALESGAPLIAVDDEGPFDTKLMARLRRVLDAVAGRRLIWHGHDYKSNLTGLLLRRKHPMHVVTTVHGWVLRTWKTPLYYAIDRWCLKRCDHVICVSTDLHERCKALGVDARKLQMIDNAIDLDQYQRKHTIAEAKRLIDWPVQRQLVGAVGRLAPEKGFNVLIESVLALIRNGLDVGLIIVGDGPQAEELRKQIQDSGQSDRIRLAGFVSAPETHFQAMDAYALSSFREGLPNVLLEAMAFQVPVVATSVAGIPRLIDGETNGRLVSPDDSGALAAALQEILSNDFQAASLAKGGRATVESQFCFQRRMESLVKSYEQNSVANTR